MTKMTTIDELRAEREQASASHFLDVAAASLDKDADQA